MKLFVHLVKKIGEIGEDIVFGDSRERFLSDLAVFAVFLDQLFFLLDKIAELVFSFFLRFFKFSFVEVQFSQIRRFVIVRSASHLRVEIFDPVALIANQFVGDQLLRFRQLVLRVLNLCRAVFVGKRVVVKVSVDQESRVAVERRRQLVGGESELIVFVVLSAKRHFIKKDFAIPFDLSLTERVFDLVKPFGKFLRTFRGVGDSAKTLGFFRVADRLVVPRLSFRVENRLIKLVLTRLVFARRFHVVVSESSQLFRFVIFDRRHMRTELFATPLAFFELNFVVDTFVRLFKALVVFVDKTFLLVVRNIVAKFNRRLRLLDFFG